MVWLNIVLNYILYCTFIKNVYGENVKKNNEFHLRLMYTHVSKERVRLYFIYFPILRVSRRYFFFFKSEIKLFSFPNIVNQRRIILSCFCVCFQAWSWWFETHKVASAYTMSKQINTGYYSRVRLL